MCSSRSHLDALDLSVNGLDSPKITLKPFQGNDEYINGVLLSIMDAQCGMSDKPPARVFRDSFKDFDDWDPASPQSVMTCSPYPSPLPQWQQELPSVLTDDMGQLFLGSEMDSPAMSLKDLGGRNRSHSISSSGSSITLCDGDSEREVSDPFSPTIRRVLNSPRDLEKTVKSILEWRKPPQVQPAVFNTANTVTHMTHTSLTFHTPIQKESSSNGTPVKKSVQTKTLVQRKTKSKHYPSTPYQPAKWICSLPGCSQEFCRETDMERHRKCAAAHKDISTTPKHICPTCKKTFTRPDSRGRHVKLKACFKRASPSSKRKLPQKLAQQ